MEENCYCCLNTLLLPAECQHLSLFLSPPCVFDLPPCAAVHSCHHKMESTLQASSPHVNAHKNTRCPDVFALVCSQNSER